ncbi:MAG: metallophosphoesterase family protein [Candidatus Nitrosopolaris sp.]
MSIPSVSKKYFEQLSNNLPPQVLTDVIENARATLEDERLTDKMMNGRNKVPVVELERIPEKLILVGDIHGDLQSLLWTLKEINFDRLLRNPHNKLIFLGDYVDRGSNSIDVLYVVCFLKQKFPDSVVLMRGNHEAPMEFPFSSHDLPLELARRYGREIAKSIYVNNILPLFQSLSLIVLIPKQLLIVHGGLPTAVFIPKSSEDRLGSCGVGSAAKNLLISSMEEILWNDPIEHISKGLDWEYSRRGYGKHFGITVTRKWLNATGSKVVIRGHEPCQGFKVNHQGTILTLFSCNESYPGFQAAYLKITREQLQNVNDVGEFIPYINRIPKLPELL